jgi:ABC-type uncharacterized transport system substrate-binding protein
MPAEEQYLSLETRQQPGVLKIGVFFASTKAAQRILAESIAREFGPKGIHTAYFVIDALIDTPRTRPTMGAGKPDDFFSKASAIADEMFHVAHQDKSTWSFNVELRPFGEVW